MEQTKQLGQDIPLPSLSMGSLYPFRKKHVDVDPVFQLGTWITPESSKRQQEGYSLDMPVLQSTSKKFGAYTLFIGNVYRLTLLSFLGHIKWPVRKPIKVFSR